MRSRIFLCSLMMRPSMEKPEDEPVEKSTAPAEEVIKKVDKSLIQLISKTITDLADENGWAFLGEVGNLLLKRHPNFDPRNYGFLKLTPLIKSLQDFEIEERETDKRNVKLIFIRNRPQTKAAKKINRQ